MIRPTASPTERLDEETERMLKTLIEVARREGASPYHRERGKLTIIAHNDLRSRIRTLVEEARKEGYRNTESSGENIGI